MSELYWWRRYGDFAPGSGILPHMGEVISQYRKQRYPTQVEFAAASGYNLRTVQEWEITIMINDHERRIFLAKLLKIPPALLGLDWRLVTYQDATGTLTEPFSQMAELIEEDGYYQYEDLLVMGWECRYAGRLAEIAPRIERRLRKLIVITKQAPVSQQEAWQYLLCQFYQLHTGIMRHRGTDDSNKKNVLYENKQAVQIATDLEDKELLVASLVRGSGLHMGYGNYDLAQEAIQGAVERVEHVRTPLKVNVYLVAANANAIYTAGDETLQKQIQRWLDKALTLVYKGKIEQDSSFLKPNRAAVHHEKAKTLLQFSRLHPTNKKYVKDARNELNLAWEGLPLDLTVWRMYFSLTEARLFVAEHDLEGGAKMAVQALEVAKLMGSKKGEAQVATLYRDLMGLSKTNPYVHNLGVQLGIF
jgi:transcriptional regulator with XRE-family HTH domain